LKARKWTAGSTLSALNAEQALLDECGSVPPSVALRA
jgi:hypothetical protein